MKKCLKINRIQQNTSKTCKLKVWSAGSVDKAIQFSEPCKSYTEIVATYNPNNE